MKTRAVFLSLFLLAALAGAALAGVSTEVYAALLARSSPEATDGHRRPLFYTTPPRARAGTPISGIPDPFGPSYRMKTASPGCTL